MGHLIRLCLTYGVEPWFTPPREPWRNGVVEKSISDAAWLRTRSLGTLPIRESGWFLVRVIVDATDTFRFASTAPFHVELGGPQFRISRASAQFFLDWVRERAARIKLPDARQQAEVIQFHTDAETFWRRKVEAANAP